MDLPPEVETDGMGGAVVRELFRKVLTQSDVGKLCRFVVHKKYAEMHFPNAACGDKRVMLTFFDKGKQPWTFRMCYWPSSQSYVFVKGWKGFVKSNNLKVNDVVVFYECKESQGKEEMRYRMIDILRSSEVGDEANFDQHNDGKMVEEGEIVEEEEIVEMEEGEVCVERASRGIGELDKGKKRAPEARVEENPLKKGVWLFGVKIG